jgi:hypothetical protein
MSGRPTTHPEGLPAQLLEYDLARTRIQEDLSRAEAAFRARRLYLARRAARRAERAVRRAARASAAVN